jgi:8-oxo-dGTP pyrophosphatase MutT (NUDIX family)
VYKDKVLFENKWVTVKERELNNGIQWVFAHHAWCNGKGVAVLPYLTRRYNDWDINDVSYLYLARMEICPAHSPEPKLCAVAGGMDKPGEIPVEVAVRELYEETGYIATLGDAIYLGSVYPSKGSDTEMYLFAVDVTSLPRSKPTGDGSMIEALASTKWVNRNEAIFSSDPLLALMVSRLDVFLNG